MRGGFSAALEARLRRADSSIRLIPEITVVDHSDQKVTRGDFTDADSTTGFDLFDPLGGVKLLAGASTVIQQTTSDSNMTELEGPPQLQGAEPFDVAKITWGGSESSSVEFTRFTAYLDPDPGATGKLVDTWYCQPFAIVAVTTGALKAEGRLELAPLRSPVAVTAGASPGNVNFDFDPPIFPKAFGAPRDGAAFGYSRPTTYMFIWAVTATGAPAGNVAWAKDSTVSSVTTADNVLTGFRLTLYEDGLYEEVGGVSGTPHCAVVRASYSAATITWSTTGPDNRLDLGATPAGEVRFIVRAIVPTGTSIVTEVRNDADSAWVPFVDGDSTDDLTGVGKNQYYKIRATLTPTSGGDATPHLLIIGVEEVSLTSFIYLGQPAGRATWGVDPFTLKAEITSDSLIAIHDGVKDYRDAITTLLSENDIGLMDVRFWLGADDLARADWLLVAQYLVDDTAGLGPAAEITLLSPLQYLRQKLPIYSVGARAPLDKYVNWTLKAIYEDLRDSQVALPGRYVGAGVEDATTQVTKTIIDSDAKDELDAIAFLAGGGVIDSQGRATFRDFYGDKQVSALFPAAEIQVLGVSPGFSKRVPEFYVPWDYQADEQRYDAEDRFINQVAFDALGVGRIWGVQYLPDDIAQWIDTQALATTVGNRVISFFSTGQPGIEFRSNYAHPELEPGDGVAVDIDRFIAKDPRGTRHLKGKLWALGVIVGQHDYWGRQFTVWVRRFADIFASSASVTVTGFNTAYRAKAYLSADEVYVVGTGSGGFGYTVPFDSETYDVGDIHSVVTNTGRLTAPAAGIYDIEANIPWTAVTGSPTYDAQIFLLLNGATELTQQWIPSSSATLGNVTLTAQGIELAAGGYVTLQFSSPSTGGTGSVTLRGGSGDLTSFTMTRRRFLSGI